MRSARRRIAPPAAAVYHSFMATEHEEPGRGREPYEPPELQVIDLAAEEVLAVGCKSPRASAVGLVACGVNRCNQIGS